MRANRLQAAVALALAGCGLEEKPGPDRVNEAVASHAPHSSATAPPRPARQNAIPVAFQGVYDSSLEACGRPSDGRLTVSAGELRFHESIGSVRKVEPVQSGAIRVEADYQGEGESWRSSRDLLLSDKGARLTISGDGTRFARVRCPGPAL